MISTVSVSTVSTITSMAATGLTAAFSMGVTVLLIVLLTTRQLVVASGNGFYARLSRFATVAVVPLFIGFGIVMLVKLIQLIS